MTDTNAYPQQEITLQELNQIIWKHLEERDWHTNHTRGLAISLTLEASELLEHFQWSEEAVGGKEAVGDELADVLIYAFQIAQRNNIDIAEHIQKKLKKAALKYPAASFKGKNSQEAKEAWIKHKIEHKKKGL